MAGLPRRSPGPVDPHRRHTPDGSGWLVGAVDR